MTDKKKALLQDASIMIIGNALVFLLAHLYFLTESTVLFYVELYFEKIWNFIFPLIAVRFALSALEEGRPRAVFSLLISALSRALFLIPFYYEYYVLTEGLASGDAVITALLRCAVMLVMTALSLSLYFLLALLVGSLMKRRCGADAPLSEYLKIEGTPSLFDLATPAVAASGAVALAELIRSLASEIKDTVDFLKASISTVTPVELFTVVFNYILLIALFFFGHYLTTRVEKWLGKTE